MSHRSLIAGLRPPSAVIAHQHHEKFDGTGYPQGLKGEAIHKYARIVAVADVFDALSHKRCYKDAWEWQRIRDYIVEQRGIKFDPSLVDLLLDNWEEAVAIRSDMPD